MEYLKSIINNIIPPLTQKEKLMWGTSYYTAKYMKDMPNTVNVYVKNNIYNEHDSIRDQINNSVNNGSQTFKTYKDQIYSLIISDEFKELYPEKCKKIIFHTKRCEKVCVINMPENTVNDTTNCRTNDDLSNLSVNIQIFSKNNEEILYK